MAGQRDLDVVLWGATGWVGRRIAQHLASRYGSGGGLRWALAGRNERKLESVRSALDPGAPDAEIILADSHDAASLNAMVERARVVCSTVGPFAPAQPCLVACGRRCNRDGHC